MITSRLTSEDCKRATCIGRMVSTDVSRPGLLEHTAASIVRVVRLCLGYGAAAARKVAHGMSLEILGVELRLGRIGYRCRPASEKLKKRLHTMREALRQGMHRSRLIA